MSDILDAIRHLVAAGDVRVSEHGYDELAADGLTAREIIEGVADALLIEDYPEYRKGPCVLVLQGRRSGHPVHAVWGIPAGHESPAVLVTAYRPDPERWDARFRRRRK